MNVRWLGDLDAEERAALLERDAGIDDIREVVDDIISQVQTGGDAALRDLTREYDGVDVTDIDITTQAKTAAQNIDADLRAAIQTAAANIREFHEQQVREDWRETKNGQELGRRFRPVQSAGVYVPGGTAAYPSSALMGVIPAIVAGVDHVAVTTPPADTIPRATLAAIHEAGADRVYGIGGAQAIAALAYGTETVSPVNMIVGPGNRWVTAAKAAVRNAVAIDFLAGPSELLVVADDSAVPDYVAADVIAQAEHDPAAAVVVLATDADVANEIGEAIDAQLSEHARSDIIHDALRSDSSGVFVADSITDACAFADAFAPEHLAVQTDNPESVIDQIPNAGSVFIGPYTPVAAGDYATGTNHVLPTNGRARVTGGLSVDTFLRATTIQRLNKQALADLQSTIQTLAHAEGLDAHAASVARRFDD